MSNYSKNDVILIRYPFSDLSDAKVRPGVIVPLTSKITSFSEGEFMLFGWAEAGLNVPSAVKRGLYTIHQALIIKNRQTPKRGYNYN
jgi:mRNA interferase MazF